MKSSHKQVKQAKQASFLELPEENPFLLALMTVALHENQPLIWAVNKRDQFKWARKHQIGPLINGNESSGLMNRSLKSSDPGEKFMGGEELANRWFLSVLFQQQNFTGE